MIIRIKFIKSIMQNIREYFYYIYGFKKQIIIVLSHLLNYFIHFFMFIKLAFQFNIDHRILICDGLCSKAKQIKFFAYLRYNIVCVKSFKGSKACAIIPQNIAHFIKTYYLLGFELKIFCHKTWI